MAEKEPEQASAEQPTPNAKAPSKFPVAPVAGGAIVFVLFVIIFSFQFGVFSSSNVKPSATPATDSTAIADGETDEESEPGDEADPYDALFDGYGGYSLEGDAKPDSIIKRDSLARQKWYEEQKAEIDRKLTQLQLETKQYEDLKSQVAALLDRKKSQEDANITSMAKLYEGMPTEDLAKILANLDDAQVSLLISRMKKQKAAELLGKLPPERAAKITQYIISMNN